MLSEWLKNLMASVYNGKSFLCWSEREKKESKYKTLKNKHIVLTQFEGCTVSGKKQGAVTYGMDQENKVSKIFIGMSLGNWIELKSTNNLQYK